MYLAFTGMVLLVLAIGMAVVLIRYGARCGPRPGAAECLPATKNSIGSTCSRAWLTRYLHKDVCCPRTLRDPKGQPCLGESPGRAFFCAS
jgi:hypothetical protein